MWTLPLTLAIFASHAQAFWRMNCANIQIGRIDPILNPGTYAQHAHTIVGGSNIGVNATFQSLISSECSSCEVTPDKSAYWTPNLYYQRPNGSFESVYHTGSVVYYLGRGMLQNGDTTITPFPKDFKMVSGNKASRRYNATGNTWGNATFLSRPQADAVSFACLATDPERETQQIVNASRCNNGLRAQIHFQSCWNGKDAYKSDQSHVAYLSSIDNGVCPPGYPVLLPHLFVETVYAVDSIANSQDGGRFVFSMGDPTGYGMHGDFMNGWDVNVLSNALKNCIGDTGFGTLEECDILQRNRDTQFTANCPLRPPQIGEQTEGMLDKLPGCIRITPGPDSATTADMVCPPGTPQPPITSTRDSTPRPTPNPLIGAQYGNAFNKYMGCGNDSNGSPLRTLNAIGTELSNMTVEYCQSYCSARGYRYSGVEYATQCWCDMAVNPTTQFRAGVNMSIGCTMTCPGNRAELCGGPNFMNVFNNTDPSLKTTKDTTNSVVQLFVPVAPYASNYLGCAQEGIGARALNGTNTARDNMTLDTCASFCQDYAYYGTEVASQCFCGNGLASGGAIIDTTTNVNQSSCTHRCNGNYSQICGGSGKLSLYQNRNYRPVVIAPKSGKYTSQGCITDPGNGGGRALAGASTTGDDMTVDKCVMFCQGKKYKYAGLEYVRECYCDNSVQAASGSQAVSCPAQDNGGMVCAGNKYTFCGGSKLLNLYYNANP